MKVLKFGGSSVAHPDRIQLVIDILKSYAAKGDQFTVVFSAFGGVTDMLIEMSELAAKGDERYLDLHEAFTNRHLSAVKELLNDERQKIVIPELQQNHDVLHSLLYGIFLVREASPRTMDYVLSFGERNSAYIISTALNQAGVKSDYLDARKIIKTNKVFGSATVNIDLTYDTINQYYAQHTNTQVVTGFIASAKGRLTTTLGRGGSDYTASLIAAGLNAEVIEIWTDVDGVLTADPRKVSNAFPIKKMTYAEAMEMSHFGAKVIYPPTLQPALKKRIPLYIKNTFNPTYIGTLISEESNEEDTAVKGISSVNHVALLTLAGSGMFGVSGTAGRLFGALAAANINIILITQGSSEHAISFAVQPQDAKKAKRKVEEAFQYEIERGVIKPIKIEGDLSVIAIIGENMRYRPGIAGHLFQALGKNSINIIGIAQGSSELNISVVIAHKDEGHALNALHEAFFSNNRKELHLFMVGIGLIGGALINQIKKQADFLKEQKGLDIKIVALANSRKMLLNKDGINLNAWQENFEQESTKSDLSVFVSRMKEMHLPNSIFIDNTANATVAGLYETILDGGISISTPNKIAASSFFIQYLQLKNIATQRNVQFRYETNVGAGLPVISTLKDLVNSGDQILNIEGVLSGSLSYIFNNFDGSEPFSKIVLQAKELGYTEPDPRTDLGGTDVCRKILILAREAGWGIETSDVAIENILPETVQNAPTIDIFFQQLEEHNDYFEKLRADAAKENKVLRMIASLDKKGATKVALEKVGTKSPFYALSGSDNMIVFTTVRYKENPLVISGPGAGAEVTAAGVFAEVISMS